MAKKSNARLYAESGVGLDEPGLPQPAPDAYWHETWTKERGSLLTRCRGVRVRPRLLTLIYPRAASRLCNGQGGAWWLN